MLELRKITKIYETADLKQTALNKVSVSFRENEFVSILGPSGSGKTTLLNIIGGLDKYDSGDLIINEVSTKDFKDRDWDAYRNHRVGFVFQNYNLISHQSILQNVELALTLSGVSKRERRKRAEKVLKEVGLKDHMGKRPNQLSGGQMQRVAIARALVNDPDIVLADEPTGALDTATSEQIMKLLKKVADKKLVIMVTHNPDLAKEYSTRIIKIQDGKIISDSKKYDGRVDTKESLEEERKKSKKTSMSLKTALGLSLNNLMTKKGRTILTAFAGSIGIIGIALIMSLSSGIKNYIDRTEKETLTSYPITLQKQSVDYSSIIGGFIGMTEDTNYNDGKIHATHMVSDIFHSISDGASHNDLKAFKEYIETGDGQDLQDLVTNVSYSWDFQLNLYKTDTDKVVRVNPSTFMKNIGIDTGGYSSAYSSMMSSYDVFGELSMSEEILESSYNLLAGSWPKEYNELLLFVGQDGQIVDYSLYTLGILNQDVLKQNFNNVLSGKPVDLETGQTYDYDDFLGLEFKLIPTVDYYKKSGNFYIDAREDQNYVKGLLRNAPTLKIVGIATSNEESTAIQVTPGAVGYTHALAEYIINKTNESEIAKAQLKNPKINILTGAPFSSNSDFDISSLTPEQQAYLSKLSTAELAQLMAAYQENANATYETNLQTLGISELDNPDFIYLYPKDFDSKKAIESVIDRYNEDKSEEEKITYTDIVGTMISSVSSIVDVISAVLIAFVAVSLIVSSIMIAIITYISVLERTKEIGILRAIGASKRDISRVFNAETLIEGLVAGLLGIAVTALLNIPINLLIKAITNISGIAALPVDGALGLIIISVLLTLIAGLIPSRMASKKDPVDALRSE